MKEEEKETPKRKRGFGAMAAEKLRAIASLGGKAANKLGVAHKWNKDSAKEAGIKGGIASVKKKRENKKRNENPSLPP